MADAHATLIAFVPGIRTPRAPAGVRDVIESEGRVFLTRSPKAPEEKTFAGHLGVRFTPEVGRTVDVVEVNWEATNTRLSGQPFFERIRFVWKLLLKLIPRARAVIFHSSPGFWLLSALMILVVLFWGWLACATALLFVEKVVKGANQVPHIRAMTGVLWPLVCEINYVFDPESLRYLIALALAPLFLLLGIDVNTFVDVTDAYERYLNGQAVFGSSLPFRKVLVQSVIDAVRAIADAGPDGDSGGDGKRKYDRVVVLGHSFGTLIAADAAPGCGRLVELITVSAFFEYLKVVNRKGMMPIIAAIGASKNISRWCDFYSREDILSARGPLRDPPPSYEGRAVSLVGVGLLDQVVIRAHVFYFSCPAVLREMFFGPRTAK